ncbi:MAG: VOC family protein [Vicinamibacteria bacterium]
MAKKKKTARKAPRKPAAKAAAVRRPVRRKAARRVLVRRKEPETLRLRSASPGFTVGDIEKSLAWYRDVLGCTVGDRWERDGKLAGVEVVAGSVTFILGQDDWKKGRDRIKGQGLNIYCTTAQKVDLLAAQIKALGGTLLQEPRDQPWGTRDFAVADPDGFKITIGSEFKS